MQSSILNLPEFKEETEATKKILYGLDSDDPHLRLCRPPMYWLAR